MYSVLGQLQVSAKEKGVTIMVHIKVKKRQFELICENFRVYLDVTELCCKKFLSPFGYSSK